MRRLVDHFRRPLRAQYWDLRRHLGQLRETLRPRNRSFRSALVQDWVRWLIRVPAKQGADGRRRMDAAVDWLLRAQEATSDGGVSLGYFPCDEDTNEGWRDSYPETTGYIMVSLIDYAQAFDRRDILENVWEMANWEADVQMESGAVQGGTVCAPPEQVAAVFNTGMVLQGYAAALALRDDERILRAACRAADFLVGDQGDDGHFRSHGKFVAAATIKTYNSLCAWPLYRLGKAIDRPQYRETAIRAVEASVREQRENGWFTNNCLTRPDAPLTHTIAYNLQGILEVGALAGRNDFLDAARRGLDPLLERLRRDGYLAGRFYDDWRPAAFSACLTGSAQLAIVAYRLYELLDDARYMEAADRLVGFVEQTQRLEVENEDMRGAVPGSFPLNGSYMSYGYPNWATKYFLDSLLLRHRLSGGKSA